ncbi:hypothetical protein Ngar_c30110 [Candidatus Nitrososphaera gargensis Ga9.2]|uniref:Uncharacterized protein n=1 Tax=Nitrososphaera gargensis (strain Ga9.2) TaxID=1237085 RepID=K0INT4_NITGG|nr:hypothetical protein [Candidatus Nitrososphaera gargensis]AFU59929.1 hypothetical protein Ngar_c30110 [Candidatus Nitrososphaera gargensis Ga9.2]
MSEERRKTETIAFRLDTTLIEKLRKEASQKEISLNTMASQIFRQHVDWHSNAAKAGFITVRKGLILRLLEIATEEQLVKIAEYIAKKETKNFVLMLRNEYNITSALDVVETWIRIAGYPYRHDANYSKHSYTIQHEMGKKWSMYLAEQYRFLFEDFGLKKVKFDITDSVLSFSVDTDEAL